MISILVKNLFSLLYVYIYNDVASFMDIDGIRQHFLLSDNQHLVDYCFLNDLRAYGVF